MLKKSVLLSLFFLPSLAMASNVDLGPDCSKYNDGSLDKALITNFDQIRSPYLGPYLGNHPKDISSAKIERISSQELTRQEINRCMKKKAKQLGYNAKALQQSGLTKLYEGRMYKQIYKITSDTNFMLIIESYATRKICAIDIGDIYIISDQLKGTAPEYFIDRSLLD